MLHRLVRRTVVPAVFAVFAVGVSPLGAQEGSPAGPVPPGVLDQRQERFLEALGDRSAVLGSAHLRDIEGDYPQDSDFRQDNDVFWLTGLEVPGAWILAEGATGRITLYLPPRDPAGERWTGPRLGPGAEAARLAAIEDVRSTARFETDLAEHLGARSAGGRTSGRLLVSAGDRRNASTLDRVLAGAAITPEPLAPVMARLRLIKDEEELRRLRRAIDITMDAHREAWRLAEPGMHEYEIEAAIEYVFRARGAERVGFPSIVGSGPNSTVLHYDRNRRRTESGDLVVVDIGAEYGYYTADVTRTFPVSGRFTGRQRAIYGLVLGAQEAALARVRPGVTVAELTAVAREHIDRHSGDLCGAASCNRFFVHGLSHWLGMDVHDVGDYGTPLAPGMVLTVEPGLYLPDETLGVRIEDDVLVTGDGYVLLTADLPRRPEEVEAIMTEDPRWTAPLGNDSLDRDPRR